MAITTTAIFTLLPRYSCKDTKVPHGGTITSTLKVTRKTSSLVSSLVTQGSGSQGCRAGVGLWGVLVGERCGTGERECKRRGEVWPARAGRRAWCPGTGQAEVLVLTALPGSIQESKIVRCRGEQVVAQRHSKGN